MQNSYFGVAQSQVPSQLFRFGDTLAGVVASLVSDSKFQFYNSTSGSGGPANTTLAAAAEKWNEMGMVKLTGNIFGQFPNMGLPQGAAGRTFDFILRIPTGAQGIGTPAQWQMLYFGGSGTRLGQIFALYPDQAQAVQVSLFGDFFNFDYAISRGTFYVLSLTIDPLGNCTLFANGAKVQTKKFTGVPATGTASAYFNIHGSSDFLGQITDVIAFASWTRVCSDTEVLARHRAAMAKWKLAGIALLDTGVKASRVLIRDWATRSTIADAAIASDGSWGVYVPQGDFEVVAVGPTGYRPVCDGPVTAVAV